MKTLFTQTKQTTVLNKTLWFVLYVLLKQVIIVIEDFDKEGVCKGTAQMVKSLKLIDTKPMVGMDMLGH